MRYLCLLRGVNVGGKNKVTMSELKTALVSAGFKNVSTFINSGNVLFDTDDKTPTQAEKLIEELLPKTFKLDSEIIKVRLLTHNELDAIVNGAPNGFGAQPDIYHSDVLFPMGIVSSDIMAITELHPEVDKAWEANGVVYYQRLSAMRTKSRLSKVISKSLYKRITIRSWNTTTKLLALMNSSSPDI